MQIPAFAAIIQQAATQQTTAQQPQASPQFPSSGQTSIAQAMFGQNIPNTPYAPSKPYVPQGQIAGQTVSNSK